MADWSLSKNTELQTPKQHLWGGHDKPLDFLGSLIFRQTHILCPEIVWQDIIEAVISIPISTCRAEANKNKHTPFFQSSIWEYMGILRKPLGVYQCSQGFEMSFKRRRWDLV